jgi:predicted RecA/RadA family phage recombinase
MKIGLSVPDYDPVTITAPSALTSGQPLLVGGMFGVVGASAASGAKAVLYRRGVFTITKLTTDDVTAGAKLYWDNGNSRLTTTAGSNVLVGYARDAAGTSATTVNVVLTGA